MGAGQKITYLQQIWEELNMKYPMYSVYRIPKEVWNWPVNWSLSRACSISTWKTWKCPESPNKRQDFLFFFFFLNTSLLCWASRASNCCCTLQTRNRPPLQQCLHMEAAKAAPNLGASIDCGFSDSQMRAAQKHHPAEGSRRCSPAGVRCPLKDWSVKPFLTLPRPFLTDKAKSPEEEGRGQLWFWLSLQHCCDGA